MNPHDHSRRAFVVRMSRGAALAGLALALAAPLSAAARDANAVVHWNSVAAEAFAPSQGTNPMAQSRSFAILHAAMHDALNAIEARYAPYTPGLPAASGASPDAAVAAAAREVLLQLLPSQSVRVEAAYRQALFGLRDDPARAAGVATGRAAALATLKRRRDDAADQAAQPAFVPRAGAGEYQFTAPFDFAAQPGWGRVTPFVVELREHRPEGPLALDSAAYARDLAEVRAIGQATSRTRSTEQTEIARFWYEDSPLGWNRIANNVLRERRVDAWQAARSFALLHFAMADGFIAGFEAKYRHRFWRPLTAIHAAAHDGNPQTAPDATWRPLLDTPPVPDHPSTHTVLGWAAAEVLIAQFGDRVNYELTSLTLPGVTRRYSGFAQAAEENGLSRLYAGIHFRHAIEQGRRQGRSIGRAVARSLAPLH